MKESKETKETKAPPLKVSPYELALLAASLRPQMSLRKDEYETALHAAYTLVQGSATFLDNLASAVPADPPPVVNVDLPEGPPARIGTLPTKPEIGNALPEPEPPPDPAPEVESKGKGFFGKKRGQ